MFRDKKQIGEKRGTWRIIVYFWDCLRAVVEKRVILFFNSHTKVVGARRQIGCIVNLGSACRGADEMFIFNFRHFPAASAAGLGCETTTLSTDNLVSFDIYKYVLPSTFFTSSI